MSSEHIAAGNTSLQNSKTVTVTTSSSSAASGSLLKANESFPFDEVFILSLEHSTEKWNLIHTQLIHANWPHKRFFAVNGNEKYGTGMEGVMNCSKLIHSTHLMSSGERGHYESFRLILSEIVERGLSRVLIIEDDQEFASASPKTEEEILRNYLAQLDAHDPEWDLVWLSWKPLSRAKKWHFIDSFLEKSAPLPDDQIVTTNVWKTGPSFGTWAMGLSLQGAQKFLNFMNVQFANTDFQLSRLNSVYSREFSDPCTGEVISLPEFRTYGFKPHIFKNRESGVVSLLNSEIGWLREFVHHKENPFCDEIKKKSKVSSKYVKV